MQKTCLYCGKDLEYQRITRKYCSDNCKQLAYYKRKGDSLNGGSNDNAVIVEELGTAKRDVFTMNGKPELQSFTVNEPNNQNQPDKETAKENVIVKQEEKDSTVKTLLPEEPLYKREHSELISDIKTRIYFETETQQMFDHPQFRWKGDTLSIVQWVTMVLRCLIESMLQLSNRPHIDNYTLFEVADAFNRLVDSYCYKWLPDNYPYKNLIQELQQKMNAMAYANEHNDKIRFRISLNWKVYLIATRFIIGKFAPKIKFSELKIPIEEKR